MKMKVSRDNLLKYSKTEVNSELFLKINPVAKPRMTHADKWKKRVEVVKYWAYRDEIFYGALAQGYRPAFELKMYFTIQMPKSWSAKKKQEMLAKPHQQTPDIDNLVKAIMDALFEEDKKVHQIIATKVWGHNGDVTIKNWITDLLRIDRTSENPVR